MNGNASRLGELRSLRGFTHVRIDSIEHSTEQVWMDGADHPITRIKGAPVDGHYTRRAPSRDFYSSNIGHRQHLSTVILYACDECVGERPAPTDRHSEAVGFQKRQEGKGADARAFLIGRYQVLAGDAREVHADLVVLEALA